MMEEEKQIDFFGDGMRIFIDYITRMSKRNPNYRPHPIIRAFECALSKIEDCKTGDNIIGVSQDGTENNIYEPYCIVLKKNINGIEVLEIRNLKLDKQLPLDIMILIFRLQIQLDKIEGNTVNPQQFVESINAVIPGNKIYALGDRWQEARDLFLDNLKKGKIKVPKRPETDKLAEELMKISDSTPWENYSNGLRAFIGSSIREKLEDKNIQVIITSPVNSEIEKYKVFDMATELLIGKSAEYLRIHENL